MRYHPDALAGRRLAQGQAHTFAQGPVPYALPGISMALKRAGLHASEAELDAIEGLLWKVNVTDGERNIELL